MTYHTVRVPESFTFRDFLFYLRNIHIIYRYFYVKGDSVSALPCPRAHYQYEKKHQQARAYQGSVSRRSILRPCLRLLCAVPF